MDNIEKLNEEKVQEETKKSSDTIEIIDVLLAAAKFLDDPENPEYVKAFEDIKQKTVIRSFLPLRRKSAVVNMILKDVQNMELDLYNFSEYMEIAITFDGLLAYTNINNNINTLLKDYDFYDILIASGYCDMILECCEKDYKRLVDMIDRLISYYNIGELMNALDNLSLEKLEDVEKAINKLKLDVKPEVISDLAKIISSQNETAKEIDDTIHKAAVEMANKIMKAEDNV